MGEKLNNVTPPQKCEWNSINWKEIHAYVIKLRQSIYRAAKEGNLKRVRSLQKMMLNSYENRCLAVRRVTQINQGKHTPGVDKLVVKTPEARGRLVDELAEYQLAKRLPAKRVYIPKVNGDKRPLGIPDIKNRAVQAMVKNALEPFWEAKFEGVSYGFRPGRSCHDAIQRIHTTLSHKKATRWWILDADIKGAFDNIDHDKLLEIIGNFPARELIVQWLKAGYMEDGVFYGTESGTPQGGVISPLLANIALHGMEEVIGIEYQTGNRENNVQPTSPVLVRYADDFVVLCHTEEQAKEIKQKMSQWLSERGLRLNEDKTKIVHVSEGFDFLGFTIRKYKSSIKKSGWITLTQPSKKSIKSVREKLNNKFKECRGRPVEHLIKQVNPIIVGWSRYFRTAASKEVFGWLDQYLFDRQMNWVNWTHPRKRTEWKRKKYWGNYKNGDNWVFGVQQDNRTTMMAKFSWTPIVRHTQVKGKASPDDPELQEYWEDRDKKLQKKLESKSYRIIASRQDYTCPHCGESLRNGEEIHKHHKVPKSQGGKDCYENYEFVHLFCHQAKHARKQPKLIA